MSLIAGIWIRGPDIVVVLIVALTSAVSSEWSAVLSARLSVLTKKLTKLGFEDCECMPGQYNHLICPMVHIPISYVLLNLLFLKSVMTLRMLIIVLSVRFHQCIVID